MNEIYVVKAPWFGWRVRAKTDITALPQKRRYVESRRYLRRASAERRAQDWWKT